MTHNSYRKTIELIIFLILAAIYFYAFTHRAFGFFFDRDDIHNLSWGHISSPFEFIRDTLNVVTMATIHTYRPMGALFYNLCYQAFGLDFPSFHLVRTALHILNASLVFVIIRTLIKNTFSAFLGAFLFTFHIAAIAAYWQFSSIFDVLCASFMFLSFFFYLSANKPLSLSMFGSFLLFFFACRTKEMAFVQPVIFFLYELYRAKENGSKFITPQNIKKLFPFFLIAAVMGFPKAYAGFSVEKENPYVLQLSSFLDGIQFYSNQLFRIESTSMTGVWLAIVFGLIALLLKDRLLRFAFAYALISIMPVLLLTNHRHGFYGYIPLFGVSLYAAELFNLIQTFLSRKKIARKSFLIMLVLIFFALYSFRNMNEKRITEEQYLVDGRKIQSYIRLLQPLRPKSESVFFFDSAPEHFDSVVLTSSIHLLYHDWTITTQIIPDCENFAKPPEIAEAYCVSYNKQRVLRIKS